jgi:tryptophanyl-tRNA synthetase
LQDDYLCFFAVADMHSITVPQVPKDLRRRTMEIMAWYLAVGLDPKKSTLFIQSQVPAHAQLCWVLNSISYMGQLGRMTQFKDKSQKNEENLNAALFTYPVLMAADILLYKADVVPVGEDQRQHMELARDLAIRFNNRYSETFVVPEPLIDKGIGRIMSLKNPSSKMSKSDPDVNSFILMLDDPDTIRRKIRRAVTDSLARFSYSDEQKGLQNLIHIHSAFSGMSPEKIVETYKQSTYAAFKDELAEVVVDALAPIQKRYTEIISDKSYLEGVCKEGAQKASGIAFRTLSKVYRKVGFVL